MKKLVKSHLLDVAIKLWFVTILLGQWIFAFYVIIYHGSLITSKGLEGMGETHMPNAYISGDFLGNMMLAVHLLTAVVIIMGGPLQLVPQIQFNFPRFHRWLGRSYLLFVFFGALVGLYLIWTRPIPSFGSIYQNIGISVEAILILVFGVLTLKYALVRKIQIHKKWALRLFIVASGVWFLRIGYKFWFFIEELFGFKIDHFFDYWSFASFLIPLGILELYLKTDKRKDTFKQRNLAYLILVSTLIMGIGIFLATTEMWIPRIEKVL